MFTLIQQHNTYDKDINRQNLLAFFWGVARTISK